MIAVLRFIGLLNAAVWFGATIFFMFGVQPAGSSEELKALLKSNFPYYSQAIVHLFMARYFHLQIACGIVALLHLLAERLYLGKSPERAWLGALVGLLALSLLGSGWVEPKLRELNLIENGVNTRPENRQKASESLVIWRRVVQFGNLLTLGGLGIYLWRIANPVDPMRFLSAGKLRS